MNIHTPLPNARGPAPRLRILLAEDDDDQRLVLVTALEAAGYQVIELEDGGEFADHLELIIPRVARFQQPDLMLSDLRMPGASGLDVVRQARAAGLTCPVVLLTAYADPGVREAAAALGNTEVLNKPTPIEIVLARIDRMLEFSRPDHHLQVLIADDNPELLLLMGESFRARGWTVEEATDGMDLTVRLLDRLENLPDLVVTDVRMPWSGGLDVLQRLKDRGWKARFIVVTGHANPETRARAQEMGAAKLFQKPFEMDRLLDVSWRVAQSLG